LDDRAGVASILYCLDVLAEKGVDLPCDIAVVFAVQEELGSRGASVSSFRIEPDAAIAVDVSFAHTPDADATQCGVLAKGPMIGWSPTLNDCMTRKLVSLCEQEAIPYQHEVMGNGTGTDAESIASCKEGIRTALLSIPLRYMHTPAELIDIRDVQWTGRLMADYVLKEAASL
jgi:endoglucanase